MYVLWKKIEFFKGESDPEAIVIAAGGAANLPQQHQIPHPESLSSSYCYLKWDIQVKKSY